MPSLGSIVTALIKLVRCEAVLKLSAVDCEGLARLDRARSSVRRTSMMRLCTPEELVNALKERVDELTTRCTELRSGKQAVSGRLDELESGI